MTENLGPAETPYEKKLKLYFEPHVSFSETTTLKFQKLPKFGCQEHCFSTCLRLFLSVEERLSYIFLFCIHRLYPIQPTNQHTKCPQESLEDKG